MIGLLSSRCTESQREAALLLGQFATATVTGNEDYKVPNVAYHSIDRSNLIESRPAMQIPVRVSVCVGASYVVQETAKMTNSSEVHALCQCSTTEQSQLPTCRRRRG